MVTTRQQRGPSFLRHGAALLLVLATLLALPLSANAHPVPRSNHDRTLVVLWTPNLADGQIHVTVHYRLEVDELTVQLEDMIPFRDEIQYDRFKNKPNDFYAEYTRIYAPILAANLLAQGDGKPLHFTCTSRSQRKTDENGLSLGHLRCDFVFQAAFPLVQASRRRPQTLTFREGNFELQNGLVILSGKPGPDVSVLHATAPDAALQAKLPQNYQPGDLERLRQLGYAFLVVHPETETPAPRITPAPPEVAAAPADEGSSFDLMQLFLSSEHGPVMLLLLAGLIGAVHALTPGHGKTLVAAYLVGQRGTVGHALVLGLVTTLTHTGVVLAIAVGLLFVSEERRQQVANSLGLAMGLALICLGFWLLLQRLAGRADHVHLGGHGHHHHGHHHHAPPPASGKLGWYGLVVMGISGGIAPCWDAVAMLGLAVGMNLLWLAVPLLLAFSAGLASVLVLIGILVVHARRLIDGRWSEGRLVRLLPIFSALFITAMGVIVCIQGSQGAFHDNHARINPPGARP